ncbi:MAG: stage III sporulation protein AF [Lutisporaceae bacterium]
MDIMKSWITNITVVIIFIMLMDIMIPNNNMKRFVKVIMGLLVILVIIKPFILAKDLGDQFQLSMTQTAAYIEQADDEGKGNAVSVFQNTAALDIYKQKLSDKITEIVKAHEGLKSGNEQVVVDIENDINKKEFGSITGVQVFIEKGNDSALQTSGIQPVKINSKTVINKNQTEYNLNNSKLSQELCLEIETALGLENTEVSIEIHE